MERLQKSGALEEHRENKSVMGCLTNTDGYEVLVLAKFEPISEHRTPGSSVMRSEKYEASGVPQENDLGRFYVWNLVQFNFFLIASLTNRKGV